MVNGIIEILFLEYIHEVIIIIGIDRQAEYGLVPMFSLVVAIVPPKSEIIHIFFNVIFGRFQRGP